MKTLDQLKTDLLADGVIDAAEVKELESVLYADGTIDTDEAEFLFELNDAVSGNNNDDSWDSFFVKAICDYLLCDEKTPGEIDAEEASWLVAKIGADGQVDGVEKKLLSALKSKAKSFPANLDALLK